jgi:hypothetical protein
VKDRAQDHQHDANVAHLADLKLRGDALAAAGEQDRVDRQLRKFFKPEFIEANRKEAERQLALLRPEWDKRRKAERNAEAELDAGLELELDADLDRFLALDPKAQRREAELDPALKAELNQDFRHFLAGQESPVAELVELLHAFASGGRPTPGGEASAGSRRTSEPRKQRQLAR